MNRIISYIATLVLVVVLAACNGKTTTPEPDNAKDKVLVSYPWRLVNITDVNNKTIPQNQLALETQAIYLFDIQFFDNNVTKAFDRVSRQVINGGTWYLLENDEVLDIEVSQFKGKFRVIDLNRTRMTLKNKIPLGGTQQDALLVFEPVFN
jgi:hypothetical protein